MVAASGFEATQGRPANHSSHRPIAAIRQRDLRRSDSRLALSSMRGPRAPCPSAAACVLALLFLLPNEIGTVEELAETAFRRHYRQVWVRRLRSHVCSRNELLDQNLTNGRTRCQSRNRKGRICGPFSGGASRARTGDLLGAIWATTVAIDRHWSPFAAALAIRRIPTFAVVS